MSNHDNNDNNDNDVDKIMEKNKIDNSTVIEELINMYNNKNERKHKIELAHKNLYKNYSNSKNKKKRKKSHKKNFKNILERNKKIKLNNSHVYTLDDEIFDSVTTVTGKINPFVKDDVAYKMINGKYFKKKDYYNIVTNYGCIKDQQTIVNNVIKYWDYLKEYGIKIHKNIEDYYIHYMNLLSLKNEKYEDLNDLDKSIKINSLLEDVKKSGGENSKNIDITFWEAFKNFEIFRINKGWKILCVEIKVFSEKYKIAGTIDVIFTDKNNNLIIGDFKTGCVEVSAFKNMDNPRLNNYPANKFTSYSLQLSLYAKILEEDYNINIKSLCIIVFEKNKNFKFFEMIKFNTILDDVLLDYKVNKEIGEIENII